MLTWILLALSAGTVLLHQYGPAPGPFTITAFFVILFILSCRFERRWF